MGHARLNCSATISFAMKTPHRPWPSVGFFKHLIYGIFLASKKRYTQTKQMDFVSFRSVLFADLGSAVESQTEKRFTH